MEACFGELSGNGALLPGFVRGKGGQWTLGAHRRKGGILPTVTDINGFSQAEVLRIGITIGKTDGACRIHASERWQLGGFAFAHGDDGRCDNIKVGLGQGMLGAWANKTNGCDGRWRFGNSFAIGQANGLVANRNRRIAPGGVREEEVDLYVAWFGHRGNAQGAFCEGVQGEERRVNVTFRKAFVNPCGGAAIAQETVTPWAIIRHFEA